MLKISAQTRINCTTSVSRKLRKQGKCPAIIYKNIQHSNIAIEINSNDLQHPKKIKYFYKNNIIQLILNNQKEITVKIQDIQYHPYKFKIIHIDFIQLHNT